MSVTPPLPPPIADALVASEIQQGGFVPTDFTIAPGVYYVQDENHSYLSVVSGKVQISTEAYKWSVQNTTSENVKLIRDDTSLKFLRDNGAYYDLVIKSEVNANARWTGLSSRIHDIVSNEATGIPLGIPYQGSSDKWKFVKI